MAEFQENGDISRALDSSLKALTTMGDLQLVPQTQLIEKGIKGRIEVYVLNDKFS